MTKEVMEADKTMKDSLQMIESPMSQMKEMREKMRTAAMRVCGKDKETEGQLQKSSLFLAMKRDCQNR